MITNGSRVRIHYTLTVDGAVIDSSRGSEPLEYEQGAGQIIPGLEEQLQGLLVGDHKHIVVPPDRAFGEFDAEAVQRVPREAFYDPDSLQVGDTISGSMQGHPLRAIVCDIGPDAITLDFNHPLAGKTLYFEIDVVSVD